MTCRSRVLILIMRTHGATEVLCQRNIPGTRGVHAKYFSPRRPGSRTLKMSSITIEKGPEKSSDQLFRLNLLISELLAFRKKLRGNKLIFFFFLRFRREDHNLESFSPSLVTVRAGMSRVNLYTLIMVGLATSSSSKISASM